MAEKESGWTTGIPKRAGWYFMRDGGLDVSVDGIVVWVGYNASGVRHEGQFFYADHKFLQHREFLGPLFPSDAEQLSELRRVAEAARDFVYEPENWEAYQDSKESNSVAWPPEFLLLAQAVEKKYGPMPTDDDDDDPANPKQPEKKGRQQ